VNLSSEEIREEATEATLCFVFEDDKVLLIEKKRGVGEDLFNGPGGKVEENESPRECAIRETKEEVNIKPHNLEKIGEIEFIFGEKPFMFVHVFKTEKYTGKPRESEEARPEWFKTSQLPFEEMWPDDKYWIPKMLNEEKFEARFYFDKDGDEIINHSFNSPNFHKKNSL